MLRTRRRRGIERPATRDRKASGRGARAGRTRVRGSRRRRTGNVRISRGRFGAGRLVPEGPGQRSRTGGRFARSGRAGIARKGGSPSESRARGRCAFERDRGGGRRRGAAAAGEARTRRGTVRRRRHRPGGGSGRRGVFVEIAKGLRCPRAARRRTGGILGKQGGEAEQEHRDRRRRPAPQPLPGRFPPGDSPPLRSAGLHVRAPILGSVARSPSRRAVPTTEYAPLPAIRQRRFLPAENGRGRTA